LALKAKESGIMVSGATSSCSVHESVRIESRCNGLSNHGLDLVSSEDLDIIARGDI
jgi:hypothetical protein